MDSEKILSKVLITGGDGTVASYVDFGVTTTRADFDITNLEQVRGYVNKMKPEVILHLAAETDMAKCEADSEHAHLINEVGTYNVAMAVKEVGAKMVYVSTDAVFPNSQTPHTADDEPKPESVYGHFKYLGEVAVRDISDDYIIARTSWVFGGGREKDKKFVGKFIANLNMHPDKPEVNAVHDEFNSPTYARDLVNALKELILKGERGIFHVANSGTASRYDMALVIAETLKKNTTIMPVPASTYGLLPYQKSSGGLVSNVPMRPWQEALKDYIQTEWNK